MIASDENRTMRQIHRSALVAQPPARMYALINDIESYPQFVPGCTSAHIESRSEQEIIATLHVRRGPLHTHFTTRNTLTPHQRVGMQLVRGPFKSLEGEWLLQPLGESGCKVNLHLRFAFENALSGMLFEPLFEHTAASLVDAFVKRARGLNA